MLTLVEGPHPLPGEAVPGCLPCTGPDALSHGLDEPEGQKHVQVRYTHKLESTLEGVGNSCCLRGTSMRYRGKGNTTSYFQAAEREGELERERER